MEKIRSKKKKKKRYEMDTGKKVEIKVSSTDETIFAAVAAHKFFSDVWLIRS